MNTTTHHTREGTFKCGKCSMKYLDYKVLLEHLYWRHGTESYWCRSCSLKRWSYAIHFCHVLPFTWEDTFDETFDVNSENPKLLLERMSDFCTCGKFIEGAQLIGCDGPNCEYQWFHFACVGIVRPPEGDWYCPTCVKLKWVCWWRFTFITAVKSLWRHIWASCHILKYSQCLTKYSYQNTWIDAERLKFSDVQDVS